MKVFALMASTKGGWSVDVYMTREAAEEAAEALTEECAPDDDLFECEVLETRLNEY